MSYGSTQTNSLVKPERPTPSQGLLTVFRRIRRKASITVIGAAFSFLGMSIAVTDASQSVFQKAIGTATLVILLGLVFFAWHIRKDADKWAEITLGKVSNEMAEQLRERSG